ncbi:peptidoglycan-binding domain-containing protein [Streptomyces sp. YU58]|uniref:peptidoglycan-binding domain-containing protein n=1 Tax=Streptomyces sp. SX92 TaxID=3158972 RepID=UPI0027BAB4C5|nr:peptidoglycan-binding domain-containing protein [Streptomyces coralus]WLW58229.1 peptidoglycan-binding domain-containing protein [Streptomyces coralus]
MRALTKVFVSVTAAVGIAAGGLATAGTAMAAPVSTQQQAASADVAPLAVVNLGLTTARAKHWQCYLRNVDAKYDPGTIDGQLGTNSWKAAQRLFRDLGYYNDSIDGIVGPNTIKGLQRFLNWIDQYTGDNYNLVVDGQAGPATKDAFWDFNGRNFCA